MKEEMSP
ncbi:Hypothetical protein LLA12_01137 [Lactococcus lactis subsp. lactis]|nr:Hypothetical protein LLA12_01137 [Lactococcus lactis subsp. lactis]